MPGQYRHMGKSTAWDDAGLQITYLIYGKKTIRWEDILNLRWDKTHGLMTISTSSGSYRLPINIKKSQGQELKEFVEQKYSEHEQKLIGSNEIKFTTPEYLRKSFIKVLLSITVITCGILLLIANDQTMHDLPILPHVFYTLVFEQTNIDAQTSFSLLIDFLRLLILLILPTVFLFMGLFFVIINFFRQTIIMTNKGINNSQSQIFYEDIRNVYVQMNGVLIKSSTEKIKVFFTIGHFPLFLAELQQRSANAGHPVNIKHCSFSRHSYAMFAAIILFVIYLYYRIEHLL